MQADLHFTELLANNTESLDNAHDMFPKQMGPIVLS